MNTKRYFSALALATLTVPLLTHAQQEEQGRVYINPAVGIIDWDGETNLDNETYWQLGAEVRMTDQLGMEVKYGASSSVDFDDGSPGDVDFSNFGVDMLYYLGRFGANSAWEPYLAAGVGHGEYDVSGGDRNEQTFGNAGFGVRYHMSDKWSLRADARALNSFDEEETHGVYTLGISYALGETAPAAAAEPAPAPAPAAPVDSDGDGVPDDRDRCPDTPSNRRVDQYGCEYVLERTETIRMEVLFGFDSAEVRDQYMSEVERVAEFLQQYGGADADIEGHADSVGTDSYNKELSQERANAIRQVLIDRFNIDPSRLTAVGYGEEKPIASNETEEGRHQNRRVVAVVKAEVEEPAMK